MSASKPTDIDKIDVTYVAHLARLNLAPDEIETYQKQLDEILGYVRKISELDLRNIEPTSHAKLLQNVLRDDVVKPGLDRETALKNAPLQSGDQFMVPKIVE
jgi:aspartyl-tRNA(Asn)/glutamyl-tRNA(Gln) amidotransferase subunit C